MDAPAQKDQPRTKDGHPSADSPERETTALFCAIGFVAATMIANIMSLRMVAPLGIIMDAGALLYPVTFILRDLLHRRAGLQAANKAVTASALCNVAMFCLFALAAWLPADLQTGPQEEFARVLLPGFLVVAGSVIAQFISERVDGCIFHRLYQDGKGSPVRAALVSNLVSIPLDSVIMCSIAFGFTTPFATLCATTASNIAIKYLVMAVTLVAYASAERRQA